MFFYYWRRRDPPGRLRGGDSFSSFLFLCIVSYIALKFLMVFVGSVSSLCIFLMFFFTIGDDGIRQVASDAASFGRVFEN